MCRSGCFGASGNDLCLCVFVCRSSYLPLSHIAAQLIDIHCLQALGGTTYFAQPDALKVRRVSLSLSLPPVPVPFLS